MYHSTQNRSFRRRTSQQSFGVILKKLNVTQQQTAQEQNSLRYTTKTHKMLNINKRMSCPVTAVGSKTFLSSSGLNSGWQQRQAGLHNGSKSAVYACIVCLGPNTTSVNYGKERPLNTNDTCAFSAEPELSSCSADLDFPSLSATDLHIQLLKYEIVEILKTEKIENLFQSSF